MADDSINVVKLLKTHLVTSTGVVATLSGATGRYIKPAGAMESPPDKYITYQIINSRRPSTLAAAGSGYREAYVQLDCWAKKGGGGGAYANSVAIAEAVIESMCTATAFSATLQREDDDRDDVSKSHRQILDFLISVTSTAT